MAKTKEKKEYWMYDSEGDACLEGPWTKTQITQRIEAAGEAYFLNGENIDFIMEEITIIKGAKVTFNISKKIEVVL